MAINFTDVKEKEEVLKVDKSKGINTPGIVSGHTYTDSEGNKRFKYEVLSVFTSNTVNDKLEELQNAIINVTGLNITPQDGSFVAGTASNTAIDIKVLPEDASNKNFNVTITPSATGLSYTTAGTVKWTKTTPAGIYTVTATSEDGNKTDEFVLELTEPVEDDTLIVEDDNTSSDEA